MPVYPFRCHHFAIISTNSPGSSVLGRPFTIQRGCYTSAAAAVSSSSPELPDVPASRHPLEPFSQQRIRDRSRLDGDGAGLSSPLRRLRVPIRFGQSPRNPEIDWFEPVLVSYCTF